MRNLFSIATKWRDVAVATVDGCDTEDLDSKGFELFT